MSLLYHRKMVLKKAFMCQVASVWNKLSLNVHFITVLNKLCFWLIVFSVSLFVSISMSIQYVHLFLL